MTLQFKRSTPNDVELAPNTKGQKMLIAWLSTLRLSRPRSVYLTIAGGALLAALTIALMSIDDHDKARRQAGDPARNITERKEEKDALLALYNKRLSVASWGNPDYCIVLDEEWGIQDEDLAYLKAFTSLRELDLSHSPVGDDGMRYVGQLTSLVDLGLSGTKVGDKGIVFLAKLASLKKLGLAFTKITDQSLRTLATLPSLEILNINNTKTTNEGLAALKDYRSLRSFCAGSA